MTGLPPLGDIRRCPKCGLDSPGTSLFATMRYLRPDEVDVDTHLAGECMIRECTRCYYSWAEAVLNP